MSDSAWVLKGVDPETRQHAVEEAQRLGVSLSDYLTNRVLQAAILDQAVVTSVEPVEEESSAPELGEFGARARFRALERRLESTAKSVDASVRTLDTAVVDIADRVSELECFAGDTAQALQDGLRDTAQKLIELEQHTTESAAARVSENTAAHEGLASAIAALSHHVQDVDASARRAETNTAVLADAHETLKYAVAGDFSAFAEEISARLKSGLREVASAADEAAAQADAAVAQLIIELRGVRESLEQSVADGVDETRRRVHAAFTDAAQRMEGLSDRVDQMERQSALTAQHLQVRMADMEDASQIALEETAESLRQAGAALAADVQREAQAHRAALESAHSDLSNEIADLRERQQGALARLKMLDANLANGANEIAALRTQLLQRVDESEKASVDRISQVLGHTSEQANALAARLTRHEAEVLEAHFQLRADNERVEASTIAALEKLAGDIAIGRANAHQATELTRTALQDEIAALRDLQAGASARLTVIDLALRTLPALSERVEKAEAALCDAASRGKLADVEAQVNLLRQAMGRSGEDANLVRNIEEASANRFADIETQLNVLRQAVARADDPHLLQRIEAMSARINAQDNAALIAADKTEDLVRMLGRLTTNYTEANSQSDDRLHKVEVALADLRLDTIAIRETPVANPNDILSLEGRLSSVERLQAMTSPDDVAALESRVAVVERLQASATGEDIIALKNRLSAMERAHAAAPPPVQAPSIAEFEQRIRAMEVRQTEALETLRADIVRFVSDNDRRLASLEHTEMDYNLAAEFDGLRRRVEERILGIELRSVRTLEQVADTVQMLEERLTNQGEGERQTA